ncbi:putative 5-dehydro-4-deoxyglucarate dehydratase [Arthrobacter sp. Bi83]|nr:putative 5-dehydro-4-deoxyglucarate dehydratase [Arthrobacter sp. Bi83]
MDVAVLKEHISSRLPFGPAGVFAACGTGEFHALGIDEVGTVVAAAVEVVAGRVPVVAGAGGPLGHATSATRAAEVAGVDGLGFSFS